MITPLCRGRYVHYDQTNSAMMMTHACRMQSHLCKELNKDVIYPCPMHITQRAIIGYDVPDTHPDLVNLNVMQQLEVQYRM